MLVDEAIEALESKIDDTAIIACSGGIDSTVSGTRSPCSREPTPLRLRRYRIHAQGGD